MCSKQQTRCAARLQVHRAETMGLLPSDVEARVCMYIQH